MSLLTGEMHKLGYSNTYSIEQVEFSPDGKYLILADFDGRMQIWNFESGEFIEEVKGLNAPLSKIYSNSKILCYDGDLIDNVVEYDFISKEQRSLLTQQKIQEIAKKDYLECHRLWRTDDKIITYHYNEAIRVWDLEMTKILYEWKAPEIPDHLSPNHDLAFDGKSNVILLDEFVFSEFNIQTGEKVDLEMEPFNYGRIMNFSEGRLDFYSYKESSVYFYQAG